MRKGVRVIIVGASISGLTLANALDRAGIDFVVLEKQKNVEVQKGASIVIFSNGFVTLDQLGLYEDIAKATHPLTDNNSRSGREARLIRHFNAFDLIRKRYSV
jgi:2-polyprenyl-6-methoxyphenol hydroxylase-like FAD-dependent oxidoreductase